MRKKKMTDKLKKKIEQEKKSLIKLCNGKKEAKKLLDDIISMDRQINVVPTLSYIEDKDIVGQIKHGAYTFTEKSDGVIVYHINGFDAVFHPRAEYFATHQISLLIEQNNKIKLSNMNLSEYLDGKKDINKDDTLFIGQKKLLNSILLSPEEKDSILEVDMELYKVVLQMMCNIPQLILMAYDNDKDMMDTVDFFYNKIEEKMKNVVLQDETPEEDAKFAEDILNLKK